MQKKGSWVSIAIVFTAVSLLCGFSFNSCVKVYTPEEIADRELQKKWINWAMGPRTGERVPNIAR
jgi:hypothetical protein